MDPDETLENARSAAKDLREVGDSRAYATAAERLGVAFDALDEWLTKGGFHPRPWAMADGDADAMNAIQAILSGNEWSADTAPAIAEIVTRSGRPIEDPE